MQSATSPQLASPFPLKSRRRSQSVTVEAIQAALGSATSPPTQPSRTARPVIAEETSPRHDGPALPAVTAASQRVSAPQYRRRCSESSINNHLLPCRKPEFTPPATYEQLMRAIQSVEVLESLSDWALITRPNGASFWVNRCTGQFRSHAPNSIYRAQAAETKNLQARIAELEEELRLARVFFGKWKVDRERMDNESLMPELAEKSAQLLRLEHSYEKLKAEQSKKDDLLKQKDAELLRRLKQIRALEEKGLKVDELTAEVARLREHTAQLQKQIRDKDFELKQSVQLQHNAETKAEIAKQAERKSRDRVTGLTDELRSEAARCAELDERLAECAEAANSRDQLVEENRQLAQQRRDADLLTSAARRAQRRFADELAAAKAECQRLRGLLEELGHSANVAVVKTEDASVGNRGNKATEEEASQSSMGGMNSRSSTRNSFSSVQTASTENATVASRSGDGSEGGGRRGSSRASRQLRERLVELHIHLGDRVALRPSKQQQQQLEAIVKYIGPLPGQRGVRYGVKLLNKTAASSSASVVSTDAAVFHSDLLLRAKQIEGVFSRKTNCYKSLDSLISEYLEMH
uniref:Kinesin-like protein n=1 Tax=Macrostomum lignano TaxID=282301 RepID=A0A1I8IQK9_9PLAT